MKKMVMAVLAMAAAGVAFSVPDTSPPRTSPREWKDERGNVIKRLDSSGRLLLFYWDAQRRLVRVDGLAHTYTPEQAAGWLGEATWVHCFEYGDDNTPIRETCCVGQTRVPGEALDPKTLTTLKRHRHVREAGHLGPYAKKKE